MVLFGTHEKFPLDRIPFSAEGSFLTILREFDDENMYLTVSRVYSGIMRKRKLIKLEPVGAGKVLPYTYEAEPCKLTMTTTEGTLEFCFAQPDHLRVRGRGVGLRFSLDLQEACGAAMRPDGDLEVGYPESGQLLFAPLEGQLRRCGGARLEGPMQDKPVVDMIPGCGGEMEMAVHGALAEPAREASYVPFDRAVAELEGRFEAYCRHYPDYEGKYSEMVRISRWLNWSHTVGNHGKMRSPAILMHRAYLVCAFCWQQSLQSMAVKKDTVKAWQMVRSMFDYQTAEGNLPSRLNDASLSYLNPKPSWQGYAIVHMFRHCDMSRITREDYADMYPRMCAWLNWWIKNRVDRLTGMPMTYHGGETGWDCTSIYEKGAPISSPDNVSWLCEMAEACSLLAGKLGLEQESAQWMAKADHLFEQAMTMWNGRRFVARLLTTGEEVPAQCLNLYLPLIMGRRLPSEVVDKMARDLVEEGNFLTWAGLASESLRSSLCRMEGRAFMRGRVEVPIHLPICYGLMEAGKAEEARLIARRICDYLSEHGMLLGFSPFDTEPFTGEPVKEYPDALGEYPWTSWSAGAFLGLVYHVLGGLE